MTGTGGRPPLLGLAAQRLMWPSGLLEPGVVWIDPSTGTIVDVVRAGHGPAGARPEDIHVRLVDLGDCTIAPGFVDIHVHGGGGYQVNGDSPTQVAEALTSLTEFHARHGTTSLLATTVSDTPARLAASVSGIAQVARQPPGHAARVLGCNLEGPFIAVPRAGAHDRGAIRAPDLAELSRLLELGEGTVRAITIAPEIEGALELAAACLDAGVTVALGHSDADFDTARSAFDAGASHATHLFNAMAPFDHRHPGLVGAALLEGRITLELICDLHHLHPGAISLAAQAAPGRTVLVTDATALAGMPPGRQHLGPVEVELVETRVVLASDRSTLAGSVLTMERAVRHMVDATRMPLADALRAASATPMRVAGAPGHGQGAPPAGTLEPGAPADLVVLDPELEVVATIVAGAVAFARDQLLT